MFPAMTKGGGQAFAFPDVCKTPAPPAPFVPIPYPNFGMINQATGTSTKVKFDGKLSVTKASEVPMTKGDEAGTLKGLISAMNMAKMVFRTASGKVKAEGKAVIHLTNTTAHNGGNANAPAGTVIAPSQTKVIIMG